MGGTARPTHVRADPHSAVCSGLLVESLRKSHGVRDVEPRVGVVMNDTALRGRVVATLDSGGLRVLAAAGNPEALVRRLRERVPDVVVLGASKPPERQPSQLRDIRASFPNVPIVCVAAGPSYRAVRDALEHGADGFVAEDRVADHLPIAVRTVASGQLSLPRELRAYLGRPILSAREKQILGMVVIGFSNAEIASKLYVAESTVKSHLSSAFAKLGVRSRNEATALILDSQTGFGTGILTITGEQDGDGPVRT
jgi:DNA-binding NarL/FixJ family response regulator